MSKTKISNRLNSRRWIATATLAAGVASLAHAGMVSGIVADDDGKAIVGAIVTLTDKRGVSESVYSDDKGAFRLATDLQGELDFWVRKRYHRDDTRKLALPAEAVTSVKVALAALRDAKAISDDHPALSHFSRIAFDNNENALFSRPNFARD